MWFLGARDERPGSAEWLRGRGRERIHRRGESIGVGLDSGRGDGRTSDGPGVNVGGVGAGVVATGAVRPVPEPTVTVSLVSSARKPVV